MKKLILVVGIALVCTPLAYGFGSRKKKRRRHIARQKAANEAFQEQVFFNLDAIPAYDAELSEMERLSDLRGQSGAFSSFSSGNANIPSHTLFQNTRAETAGGNQRRGHHTSTSLPFLDTSNQADLAYKLEAVKIAEATLKELKQAPSGAAGGFKMMGFLGKLMGKVSPRQKGLVNSMRVLITVPYFATLASAWWMGPNTAMDISWPGAKGGVSNVIEQVLKGYGRIGQGMNLGSYAEQLTGGLGDIGGMAGGIPGVGNMADLGLGNLGDTVKQVNGSLGNMGGLSLGDLGSSASSMLGKVGGNLASPLGDQLSENLNLGERLGLGEVSLGPLSVDLGAKLDEQVSKQVKKVGQRAGQQLGDKLNIDESPLGKLNTTLGAPNRALNQVGLNLNNVGQDSGQIATQVGKHFGRQAAGQFKVGPARLGPIGGLVDTQVAKRVGNFTGELSNRIVQGDN